MVGDFLVSEVSLPQALGSLCTRHEPDSGIFCVAGKGTTKVTGSVSARSGPARSLTRDQGGAIAVIDHPEQEPMLASMIGYTRVERFAYRMAECEFSATRKSGHT